LDNVSRRFVALTDAHVLAVAPNHGKTGVNGDKIIEPNIYFNGCTEFIYPPPTLYGGKSGKPEQVYKEIGRLWKKVYSPNGDEASIAINSGAMLAGVVRDIGQIAGVAYDNPGVGVGVQKTGSATCHTSSSIAGATPQQVCFGTACECGLVLVWRYPNNIQNGNSFSNGGDSGSLVVTIESCPRQIGLIKGVDNTFVYITPMDQIEPGGAAVIRDLNISLVGGCTNNSPPGSLGGTPLAELILQPNGTPVEQASGEAVHENCRGSRR
jgi:hypothetical protein